MKSQTRHNISAYLGLYHSGAMSLRGGHVDKHHWILNGTETCACDGVSDASPVSVCVCECVGM